MGVEPTRDRAERPLSRFEDGETHRGPYTSMFVIPFVQHIVPFMSALVKLSGQMAYRIYRNLSQRFDHQFGGP